MGETTLPGTKSTVEQLEELQQLGTVGEDRFTGPAGADIEIRLEKKPPVPEVEPVAEVGEAIPPEDLQIQQIKQEAELEKSRNDQIQQIRQQAVFSQQDDIRGGVSSVFLDLLDVPGDLTATIINFLLDPNEPFGAGSNGEHVGRALQDGLNKVYEIFGGEPLSAEETGLDKGLPTGGFTSIGKLPIFPSVGIRGFDLGPLIPEAEPEFGNVGTQERSRYFVGARTATENAIITALTPALRLLKNVPDIGPLRTRDKVRKFLKQIGDITTSQPQVPANLGTPGKFASLIPADRQAIKAAAVETAAGISLAVGMDVAERKYPGSEVAKLVFGTAFASGTTLLPLRTVASYTKQWHKMGVAKWGGPGAKKRAQTVLHKETVDTEKALENLRLKGKKSLPENTQGPLEEEFIPGFFEHMGPALRTGDEGTINLFTAFLRESEKLEMSESVLHQQMSDLIMATMRSDVTDVKVTQETLKEATEALKDFIVRRKALAEERFALRIAESKSAITQDEAHMLGVEIITAEQKIVDNTVDQAWTNVDLTMKTTSAPSTNTWRKVLGKVSEEEGNAIFKLVDGERDLYKFLGKLKHTPGTKDPITGHTGPGFTEYISGSWGKEVTMKQSQDLRSRILRTIRKEQVELVPNNRKIDILNEVADSLLHNMGALDRALLGPLPQNAHLYDFALKTTRIAKEKFGPHTEVGKVVRIRPGGKPLPENLALKNIFLGAGSDRGAKGDAVIKQILASLSEGGRTAQAREMSNAMEQLFRLKFTHASMNGGTFNPSGAQHFLENHAQQLKNFRGLRDDLQSVIDTGDITKLRLKGLKNAEKQVNDPSIHMSTLYAERGPDSMFKDLMKEQPSSMRKKKIRKVIKDTKRDPTGQAREGLKGSFFNWMMKKSTHEQKGNIHNPEILSGASLHQLWKTESIQEIAKEIFSPADFVMMNKILASTKRLDQAVLAHATRGGSFDLQPNRVIERLLRVAALKIAPLPSSGGASIAQAQILSNTVKDKFRQLFKDPAHHALYDAFMNKNDDLLQALFSDTIKPEDVRFAIKQINAWLPTALINIGERSINEEDEE